MGFKPTYKGWKLSVAPAAAPLLPRFKPTYKGWKLPSLTFATPAKSSVLSLPTRDGNRNVWGDVMEQIGF